MHALKNSLRVCRFCSYFVIDCSRGVLLSYVTSGLDILIVSLQTKYLILPGKFNSDYRHLLIFLSINKTNVNVSDAMTFTYSINIQIS